MQRFVPRFQGRPWVDGMRVLHVYVVPREQGDDELLALARACAPLMADYPIDPQLPADQPGPGLLHMTLDMLADAPSTEYDAADRHALADALQRALKHVWPFTTELGPPIANRAGVVLDVWPDAEIEAVTDRVRAAIREVRGDAALRHQGGRPHMSLGYSHDTASSDPLNTALRNDLASRRAPLRVDRVHLLDVRWSLSPDTARWHMDWEPVAEIPLGG
ncbi:2'-5' RNA ligase family protein [Streptomyces sp. NPDC057702]|uniref:2'-5' RNA ligase family protein n=1 Tax=unclassified Streptomyces TaxID=2593676 RepID=UPI00369EC65B